MKRVEVLYPKDLTRMFRVCRATIYNREREGRLPPRDVYNGQHPVGWLLQTLKDTEKG